MEDAGTVDLRGSQVLPYALKVIKTGKIRTRSSRRRFDSSTRWTRSGAHRRDFNDNGTYDEADAVRIMDAWWPRLIKAEFKPTLGKDLFDTVGFHDDAPGPIGSAYNSVTYGYARRTCARLFASRSRAATPGSIAARASLEAAARRWSALAAPPRSSTAPTPSSTRATPTAPARSGNDAQYCHDTVRHRATGAITQPPIEWINRPTFQQVVEIKGHRSSVAAASSGRALSYPALG